MNKTLLLIAAILVALGFLAAKRRVREAEQEAALWAEATDPLE
ncbi:DLW-39 family protein [Aestuariimicrobium soli]